MPNICIGTGPHTISCSSRDLRWGHASPTGTRRAADKYSCPLYTLSVYDVVRTRNHVLLGDIQLFIFIFIFIFILPFYVYMFWLLLRFVVTFITYIECELHENIQT